MWKKSISLVVLAFLIGIVWESTRAQTPALPITPVAGVLSWGTEGAAQIGSIDLQIFTSSGTWTKPADAIFARVVLIGGGGGGGSGRRGAAGTTRSGGGGGAGGGYASHVFQATLFGATETVTVGTGGAGGAAVTTNDTNGNNGTAGGATTFGAHLRAEGGDFGDGSDTTSGPGGAVSVSWPTCLSCGGAGSGSGSAGSGGGSSPLPPASGSGGGGVSSGDVGGGSVDGGDVGGTSGFGTVIEGGALPLALGANGGDGADGPVDNAIGGAAGSGGAGNDAGAGGNGGAGGDYGGGGGGGGGTLNGNDTGVGGAGAIGFAIVITYL